MKTSIKIIFFLCSVCLLSCTDNNDMLTVVNKDGSCYREFVSKVDSSFMLGAIKGKHNPFPVEIDSTWNIRWQYGKNSPQTNYPLTRDKYKELKRNGSINNEANGFIVSIRCPYRSVDEMSRLFHLKSSHKWAEMKVSYRFEKKFRWFYTYYTYRECYPKLDMTFSPLQQYMSQDEVKFWFTGTPDLLRGMNGIEINNYISDLNDKFNKWIYWNYWDAMYAVLTQHFDELDLPVSKERFLMLKDTIFEKNYKKIEEDELKIAECLDHYFKTDHISRFGNAKDSPLKQADVAFGNQDFVQYLNNSFTYKLIMPGKVLKADNAVLHSDTLIWNLTAYRMFYDNYAIEATSRAMNIWAFIVTALIILAAIFFFLYEPRNK